MKIETNIENENITFDKIPEGSCFRFLFDYEWDGQKIYFKCSNGVFVDLESGELFKVSLEGRKYSVVVLNAKVVIE